MGGLFMIQADKGEVVITWKGKTIKVDIIDTDKHEELNNLIKAWRHIFKLSGIYGIRNLQTNAYDYVGSSDSLFKRVGHHLDPNTGLNNEVRTKFYLKNEHLDYEVDILVYWLEGVPSRELLDTEAENIIKHNTLAPNGLNLKL